MVAQGAGTSGGGLLTGVGTMLAGTAAVGSLCIACCQMVKSTPEDAASTSTSSVVQDAVDGDADWARVEGVIRLRDTEILGVQLTEINVKRELDYVVVSAMAMSPMDRVEITIGRSPLIMGVLNGGKQVYADAYDVGGKGWGSYHRSGVELRPEIAMSVRWRMEVPATYDEFQVLDLYLWNRAQRDGGTASFHGVPVPK